MIVTAIGAIDRNGLIGDGGAMPWHLPRDLRRFRKHTLGKPLIMGRRTLESLPAPLDGRLNIVLTRNLSYVREGCRIARSLETALRIAEEHAGQTGGNEAMVIGGGVVFEETATLWDRLLLTVVAGDFEGKTFFPLGKLRESRWRLVDQETFPPDAKNPHHHRFLTLERAPSDGQPGHDFDIVGWLRDSVTTFGATGSG